MILIVHHAFLWSVRRCARGVQAKIEAKTKARQSRVLLATIAAKDYAAMDKDGDGRVSPIEFLSRTLVLQVKKGVLPELLRRTLQQ